MTSLNVGHMKTPSIIPSGYADESDPKDAPIGREKCSPNAGWMGDAMVKPSRFRNDASRMAGTERSPICLAMKDVLKLDGCSLADSVDDCFNEVERRL